jgi:hypothetical protein
MTAEPAPPGGRRLQGEWPEWPIWKSTSLQALFATASAKYTSPVSPAR